MVVLWTRAPSPLKRVTRIGCLVGTKPLLLVWEELKWRNTSQLIVRVLLAKFAMRALIQIRFPDAISSAVLQVATWCGVAIEPVHSKSRWSSDVTVWRVCDSPGGFVYIDVGHRVLRTCCTAVQAGIRDDAFPRRQQPGIAVVSVSTRGAPDGCISPHTLANLFHELGHDLHHIIGCTPVRSCLFLQL